MAIVTLTSFLFLVALLREYLWPVGPQWLAWSLAVGGASLAWRPVFGPMAARLRPRAGTAYLALAVLLPLYFARAVYPDFSVDVWDYHLDYSERALRTLPLLDGTYIRNPCQLGDLIFGLFRHALGFRLGTFLNVLALAWCAVIIDRLVKRRWVTLAILLGEGILFQLSSYLTDLLPLPFMLEATALAIAPAEDEKDGARELREIGFFMGMAVAIRLNAALFIIPIFLARRRISVGALVALLVPVLPTFLGHWYYLGNPVFPYLNPIFRSTRFEMRYAYDTRMGPRGFIERIIWPFSSLLHPERASQIALTTGRLAIGLVVALFTLRRLPLAIVVASGVAIWSCATGYFRFGIYLELASFWLVAQTRLRPALALTAVSLWFGTLGDWGGRAQIPFDRWRSEARHMLRDYRFAQYVPPDIASELARAEGWMMLTRGACGYAMMLKDMPYPPIHGAAHRFAADGTLYALITPYTTPTEMLRMQKLGYRIERAWHFRLSPFSEARVEPLVLVRLANAPRVHDLRTLAVTPAGVMPAEGRRAAIDVWETSLRIKAGSHVTLPVRVKNTSPTRWPGEAGKVNTSVFPIALGNHWIGTGYERGDDGRAPIMLDVPPGDEVVLPLAITAPPQPGSYKLQLDMLQERVSWFSQGESAPKEVEVMVY